MRRLAAILAMLAAPAWAIPPQADDFWAAAAPSTGGATLADDLIAHANCKAYWHASYGVTLDGTNVTEWVDQKSGIVAAPTNASTTPWFDSSAYGGKGAVVFGGAQALNLNGTLSSTNSTTIMVGWRPTGLVYLVPLARNDSDGLPGIFPGNNSIYFSPDANDKGVVGSINGASFSNNIVLATSHTGGNTTTNNTLIFQNGTNLLGVANVMVYDSAGPGPIYNRIGGRRNVFSTGRLMAIIHFQPQLSDAEITNFIRIVKTEWGI